ncbi:NADH-quinone oxidoreductase subunit I OS=Streptomyces microflavus OX=1919 GN=nuoI1 PE=3 SV=1 [Streptomyces microflavus]
MVDSPHAIFPGMDDQDYYRGLVTEAAPGTVPQPAVSKGEAKPDESAGSAGAQQGRGSGA